MAYQPQSQFPCLKGLIASSGPLAQPKNAVARISNLTLTTRGALSICDGTGIINAFGGSVTSGRGRFLCEFLYSPTGVAPYYMVIAKALDKPLGPPTGLSAILVSGGSLTSGTTYYYKVTALDGAGGETTTGTNVVSATPSGGNLSVMLTWNTIPNAFGYNIYRGTTISGEVLLIGANLPVLQPNPLTLTTSYTDTGAASASISYNLASWSRANEGGGRIIFSFTTVSTNFIQTGTAVVVSGTSINGNYLITLKKGNNLEESAFGMTTTITGTGGAISGGGSSPPVVDTTIQTALYLMPSGTIPISYSNANIVALFPAAPPLFGVVPSGGSGGAGTTGPGENGQQNSTPPGGIIGCISLIPQMVQFTNYLLIALGNGFNPQIYSDATGTPTNPAFTGAITGVSVSNDQATFTTSATLTPPTNPPGPQPIVPGTNVIINVGDATYNGAFVVLAVNTGSQTFTVRNPSASGGATTGGFTVSTSPITNTFVPSYDAWAASTQYALGSVVVPANTAWTPGTPYAAQSAIVPIVSNNFYYVATVAGTSSSSEPAFPTTIGLTVTDGGVTWLCAGSSLYYYTCTQAGVSGGSTASMSSLFGLLITTGTNPAVVPPFAQTPGGTTPDGSVVWTNSGLVTASAPAPPGAAHMLVYSGALWVFDTNPTNTSTSVPGGGIDGPCAIRMSNVNNPTSWNPVNAAFLDKDDGTEGMGLASFTITAEGIPPEGSLVAFKQYATYQITGVFGASNFSIQRVKTDMGSMAPRTSQFIPGFGVARFAHLGIAVFDGVNDRLVSEPIRPYLYPSNDEETSDITVMDANWMPASYGFQTANPPMYGAAIPIGTSNGNLTRILCYDLVLKAWVITDLPFAISCAGQARPVTSNPITVFGGASDGVLQRWQAGDILWYTGDASANLPVTWSFRTLTEASKNASQRLWARSVILRGQNTATAVTGIINKVTVQILYGANQQLSQKYNVPTSGDIDTFASVGLTDLRFAAIFTGNTQVEIDGVDWLIEPRPVGVPISAI